MPRDINGFEHHYRSLALEKVRKAMERTTRV